MLPAAAVQIVRKVSEVLKGLRGKGKREIQNAQVGERAGAGCGTGQSGLVVRRRRYSNQRQGGRQSEAIEWNPEDFA